MAELRNHFEFRDQAGEIENSLKDFRERKAEVLKLASNRGVASAFKEEIISRINRLHKDQNRAITLADFKKAIDGSLQELRYMKDDVLEVIETFRTMMNFDDDEAVFELDEEGMGIEI